jgi:putative endonuclease
MSLSKHDNPKSFLSLNMLFVYILKCADKSYYVGVTKSIEIRVHQHNEGIDPKAYTCSRRPVELVYFEAIKNNLAAIAREKQLQGWSRAKKEALIEGNWDKVIELSKNYKIRFGGDTSTSSV